MEKTLEGGEVVHRMKRGRPAKVAAVESPAELPSGDDFFAIAYAQRIWDGQSIDVPPAERIERVCNALKGQSLNIPSLTFLHPDADRYTKAHL